MNEIERMYLVDLDVVVRDGESLEEVCKDLTIGLLILHSVLIDDTVEGLKVTQWPVVRFTGPRNQLEELLNRYNGVVGAFTPSDRNPNS